jgi:uncharacterized protein
MTIELRPLGVKCNIQCQYCYQNPQRDAGNVPHSYNMEKMKAAIEKEGGSFSLFGGEALLVPESDLEELWSWGFQKHGYNGIQTNGTLINDNHIRMFKQYKVGVGISIDGPGELNDVRWVGSVERTREATAKTLLAIERLCQEGIPPSLIVTLHRCNATKDKLPVMHDWFRYLESIGITSARLHILEVEGKSIQDKYTLSVEENIEAFLSFTKLEQELTRLKFDVFQDMRNLLLGQDNNTTCVWNACDPYTTRAVRGVEGNGQSSNCGRTNKDGIDFTKANTEGFERYLALYHTHQEYGGCKGCRFFLMCKGECPGTSIDGDWRNRTQDCEVWKSLFRHLEEETILQGSIPISIRSDRKQLEKIFMDTWAKGQNINISSALQWLSQGQSNSAPNSSHGDIPHGDSHGDHTDNGVAELALSSTEN